jgi:hypothetical protein
MTSAFGNTLRRMLKASQRFGRHNRYHLRGLWCGRGRWVGGAALDEPKSGVLSNEGRPRCWRKGVVERFSDLVVTKESDEKRICVPCLGDRRWDRCDNAVLRRGVAWWFFSITSMGKVSWREFSGHMVRNGAPNNVLCPHAQQKVFKQIDSNYVIEGKNRTSFQYRAPAKTSFLVSSQYHVVAKTLPLFRPKHGVVKTFFSLSRLFFLNRVCSL